MGTPPTVDDPQLQAKLDKLVDGLKRVNTSVTSVHEREDVWRRHILDSLTALELNEVTAATQAIDIGTGAGFPGLVLAAALPDAEFCLLDSVRKKAEAANELAIAAEIQNVSCVWARVEDWSRAGADGRERYDLVTARALAQLAVLIEYASPLLAAAGVLVAWKGELSEQERTAAETAADKSGMKIVVEHLVMPFKGSSNHRLIVVQKCSETPATLPRRPGVALRKPL